MNPRFSVLTVVKKSMSNNVPFSVISSSTVPAKLHSAADYYLIKGRKIDVTWYCYSCPSVVDPAQEDEIIQQSEGFSEERAEKSEPETEPELLEDPDADTVVADLTVPEFHIESIISEPTNPP